MHSFVDSRGKIFPCCLTLNANLPNVDAQGAPWQVQNPRALQESWNSSYMKQLRGQMMGGGRPGPCESCYACEDVGMPSQRQMHNARHAVLAGGLLERTSPDGSAPGELRSIDLQLGNVCNLQCRMCLPRFSKNLIREWADIQGVAPDNEYFEPLRKLDWFESPRFWEEFEPQIPQVERIHFLGGEPLLIGAVFRFLERLVASGRAAGIVLSYSTNLTVLPKAIYELWPHFRKVHLIVSLDGVGAVNDFIRHPSRWEQLRKNLETVDRDCAALNCAGELGFNTTVQVYNIFRLPEMLEYTASLRNFAAPNLNLLTYPDHFDVRVLPGEMKAAAAARLRECAEGLRRPGGRWTGRELNRLCAALEGVARHMLGADHSALLPEFVRWSQGQDRHRGQNTGEVLPELQPLFDERARPPEAIAATQAMDPVADGSPIPAYI